MTGTTKTGAMQGDTLPMGIQARLSIFGQQFYTFSHRDCEGDGEDAYELCSELESRGFEVVGSGGGRRVFKLPSDDAEIVRSHSHTDADSYVVKFALYAIDEAIDGRAQNRREMEMSENTPYPFDDYILRPTHGDRRGFWVIQPYVEIVEEATHSFYAAAGEFSDVGHDNCEFARTEDWGYMNDRLRLVDFGYIPGE